MSDSQKGDGWLAFRSRDFRFFFGSRFLSSLCAMMIDVGLGWMVYTRTNSVWALGLVGLFCAFSAVVACVLMPRAAMLASPKAMGAGVRSNRRRRTWIMMPTIGAVA